MTFEVLTPDGSIITDLTLKSSAVGYVDPNDSQGHFELSQETQGLRIENLGPESEFLSFALEQNKMFCSLPDCAFKYEPCSEPSN